MVSRLLRARETCERLGCSYWKLRQLVASGHLRPVRLGGPRSRLRFVPEELDELIERSRIGALDVSRSPDHAGEAA